MGLREPSRAALGRAPARLSVWCLPRCSPSDEDTPPRQSSGFTNDDDATSLKGSFLGHGRPQDLLESRLDGGGVVLLTPNG